MKAKLDLDKIAKGLGAERRWKIAATVGYFGAMQLLADIEARLRVPPGGVGLRTPLGPSGGSCRSHRERWPP